MKPSLTGITLEELADFLRERGVASYRAKQIADWIYKKRVASFDAMSDLPNELRSELAAEFDTPNVEIVRVLGSKDTTQKFLFRLRDQNLIESVLIPASPALYGQPSDRRTICVSSQVGCAVECAFCMTALLGLHRNLTAGEIVSQILTVLSDQQAEMQRDRVNLVFMGQGEPFLNYDNFMQAVRLLVEGVGIPESRMTVSTSGIVPRITDFGAEPVRPKLAVSLNAPNETLRTQVMPITKKWTIEKLIAALRDFPLRNRERLTFEYVLLGGVNDDPQHAREMVDLIRGLRAKVNLIALNPGPEIPFVMPTEDRVLAFQSVLTRAGIPTFVRRPRGRDIYAACGQLKHTTELVQLRA